MRKKIAVFVVKSAVAVFWRLDHWTNGNAWRKSPWT